MSSKNSKNATITPVIEELHLPPPPAGELGPVKVWSSAMPIPTYLPCEPERLPMFLEKRVYQGSSGRVYPLPFTDRISDTVVEHVWQAVHLENEYLRVVILPELGGRIHVLREKVTGYDLIYRQDVIKPALVGLAGPWISGGIEFNWAQHHRPSTFMPTGVEIERASDGSITVWLGEHEPMERMKGMHGVCLRPGTAVLEVKGRIFNRTELRQTFLWWMNIATEVHEQYQSFFPPDVYYVADHAKRAMSRYPQCTGSYYGVDYGKRGREGVPENDMPRQFQPDLATCTPDDLSWYANIPVPTSYMCMGSKRDFFGGYDHRRKAGLVHIANRHIAPGKKQWTWGNHEFGYAWDRNLTEPDSRGVYRPYIELMAGVYTDNQPDFSFIGAGEERRFSQYIYPLLEIGPAVEANTRAALSVKRTGARWQVGVCVTEPIPRATVRIRAGGKLVAEETFNFSPLQPTMLEGRTPALKPLTIDIVDASGDVVLAYQQPPAIAGKVPPAATEPPMPRDVRAVDELFLIGLHLKQYRHATRMPEDYWREALRRDPSDSRCNTALGEWHLRRGEYQLAADHLNVAASRLTSLNPNPVDGEAHYLLGLVQRRLGNSDEAYESLYKATWNVQWQAPAWLALAEMDCTAGRWAMARDHLQTVLRINPHQHWARALLHLVGKRLGLASAKLQDGSYTPADCPLDAMSVYLVSGELPDDDQIRIDMAIDLRRAGFFREALQILSAPMNRESAHRAGPIRWYFVAWLCDALGDEPGVRRNLERARKSSSDWCFPARLDEMEVLIWASGKGDHRAQFLLGNFYYDRKRYLEAIKCWRVSTKHEASNHVAWRNLGIAEFNFSGNGKEALRCFRLAMKAAPDDARLFYEYDQLRKRMAEPVTKRLAMLSTNRHLVNQRDDLSLELCAMWNLVGRHREAVELLRSRRFQPWEGGEGLVLSQYVQALSGLARLARAEGKFHAARELLEAALNPPENLSEARHLLANDSDVRYRLGCICDDLRDSKAARYHWTLAATFRGDFQDMSVKSYSEMTYFTALSLARLGQTRRATRLLAEMYKYGETLAASPAVVDYFATSLPLMLLFNDDIQKRQQVTASLIKILATVGQHVIANKRPHAGLAKLSKLLRNDPTNALASTILADFAVV